MIDAALPPSCLNISAPRKNTKDINEPLDLLEMASEGTTSLRRAVECLVAIVCNLGPASTCFMLSKATFNATNLNC